MNKKLLARLSLCFIVLITLSFYTLYNNNEFNNYRNPQFEKSFDNFENGLKSSDYSSNLEGLGEKINITLHQSLLNSSEFEFTNLDISNSFTEPFPIFSGYNTSFINITISNINAPNKTLDLEKDTNDVPISYGSPTYAFSFDVLSNATLKEFEVCLTGSSGLANAGVGFQIWNATWTGSAIIPDTNTGLLSHTETVYTTDNKVWHKISPNIDLSPSETDNDTFFIVMWNTNIPTSYPEFNAKNDGAGEFESLVYYMPVSTWISRSYEICSNVSLTLSDNTPKPTDINMQINSSAADDDLSGENSGYWKSTQIFSSSTEELNFSITTDWWDVSCNVSNVHINYTKTDLLADSDFIIPTSGQESQWNVSISGGLNYFDSRISNYNTINFTIPETWKETTIKVFNDTVENTNLVKRVLGDGYREVQVLNAGNGTNWYLLANSTNFLSSIDSYVSGVNTNIANYSNIVDFNATFSKSINNGKINLSIYNPQEIDNKVNYTREITVFTPGSEINLGNWDIANNITQYGKFRVLVSWSNNTAAGFLEIQITVFGETELSIIQPSQNSTFNSDEIFNTTIYFKDDGQNFGIESAIIIYRISGGSWSSTNITELGVGNYNITINCSESIFDDYGNFNIQINASKSLHNNQSITLNFKILGLTDSDIDSPSQDQTYDSDEILTILLSYDDSVKGLPVTSADVQWKVGLLGTYSSTNVSYVGGNYEIELWLSHSLFDGYGPFTLYFTLNKTYYYNQTEELDFSILGLTNSQIDSPAQDQTYDSDEILTIILSYDDPVKNLPIISADIQWKVGLLGTYSSTNVSYIGGNYEIELWLRASEFDSYGPFTLYFMLNKTNYYNQTEELSFNILGLTSSQIDSPVQDQTYDSDEILTILLSYDDIIKNLPITSADIQWKLGLLGTYSSTNVSYVSGNYEIDLWLSHSLFDGYGPFTLYFTLNKTYYYNQTEELNFNILGLTNSQIDSPSQDQTYNSDEILTIILSYDDSVKNLPIISGDIQWKVGLLGTYSSTNVSYVGGNYEIELWLRASEFNGYGPYTIYFMLNKTNYYNQTLQLVFEILGLTSSDIDSPIQDQTYNSDEILTIILSYDDPVKNLPIISADIQWKVGLLGTYSSTNVSYVGENYEIELWLRASEFDNYGPFTLYFMLNKTNYYNQTLQLVFEILGLTSSDIDSPIQDQTYNSDEILTIILSFDDSVKNLPITSADIQWKLGLLGTYSSTNVSYVSGNYQIELWLRASEFDNYGPFTLYFMLNKTNYYNQTEELSFNILGLTSSQIDSPAQDQTYDSDEILTIILSFDDSVKNLPITSADIQWKLGLFGTYTSTNVSYVSGNYEIELWLRASEFNGYGPFTLYFMLNKTNYYNQTEELSFNILGLTSSQIDSPAQDQTYDSDDILTIILSYDDSVKSLPITSANIQWKVGLLGTYSSTNVSYVGGNYQIELWMHYSEFNGYGPFTLYFLLNKTYYYNKTFQLDLNILGLTTSLLDSPAQDQTYDSDEILTIILSYDDSVKSIPIASADVQWKVGLLGTYSSTNVSYVSGNYQIELWLRASEFNGYGPFTLYFMLNKTNYYNKTEELNFNILGLTDSQIDSPTQDQTYDSDEILTIILSYDDSVKSLPITSADIQWKVGVLGTYFSTNVSYVSGNYELELWLRDSLFDGFGPFTLYFMLNKTNYYNQTLELNLNILGLTAYSILNLTQYGQELQLNSSIYEAFQGDNITLYMNFINLYPYSLISGAFGNLTFQGLDYLNYSDSNGLYSWEIDTSDLLPGSFSFIIQFNKSNYYNQSLQIQFDINVISTEISIESFYDASGTLDPYFDNGYAIYTSKGDSNVTFIISYLDLNHTYPIEGANGNVTVKGKEFLSNITLSNGHAWFSLSSSNYEQSDFIINVTFWKPNYYQYTLWFNLSIVKYETNSSLLAVQQTGGLVDSEYNGTHYIIYRNYNTTVLVEYWNEDDNIPVVDADVSFILRLGLNTVYSDSSLTNSSGQYKFYIPTHDYLTGNYEFTITFSKEDYKTSIIYGNMSIVYIPTNGTLLKVTQINHVSGLPENLTYHSSNNTFVGLMSYNTTIYFTFWDELNEEWINSGANCILLFNEGYYYNSSNVIDGTYSWIIPTYDKIGTFIIKIEMTKFNWANVSYEFNLTINSISTSSQFDSPAQYQTYDSDEIILVIISFDDSLLGTPITGAVIQWKVGLIGTYSSSNVSYVGGNYQIELWMRYSEFDGYGPFTLYFMLNKTYYQNQTLQLDFTVLGLTSSQIDSPAQDQTYNSDEIVTIILSFDDLVKSISVDGAFMQWKIGLIGTFSSSNVSYVGGNYQIELWMRYSEFDGYGPFILYFMLNKTNYYNQTLQLDLNILGLTSAQIDFPAQDQTYDSDDIVTIILSIEDSVKNLPISGANIQWKIGFLGTYSNTNVSYVAGNYQIELWMRYSEFNGYGPFTVYFMLNKTYFHNQTLQLDFTILGLTSSQIDFPAQDQTYNSDEIVTIILSFDDILQGTPITGAVIQWKVGLIGTYSSTNISYVGGNYEIELWMRYSEFDGYGPFTLYFMLNKTNYHNQSQTLIINLLGLTASQVDYPSSDETFYSNETLSIELSFDDNVKGTPVTGAIIQWKVGMLGTYSSANVSYISGSYQIELWLRHSLFDGYGPFTLYFMLNKTYYYNQTESLDINIIGLTSINIMNITQYNQVLTLNGSIYEAQAGSNLTVFANFICDYPQQIITNAIGILSFNGEDYISLGDINGIYEWQINTISLPFGIYDFNITFSKINYENNTYVYDFRVNNLIARIMSVQKPVSVKQGASFSLSLKLYYELYEEFSINNANLSIWIDFGTSISFQSKLTNASGVTNYQITVPINAVKINITAYFLGNGTYTAASLEIADIELIPLGDGGSFPPLPFLLIIVGASIGALLTSLVVVRRRSKKKKASVKTEGAVKQKPSQKLNEPIEKTDKQTKTSSEPSEHKEPEKENEVEKLEELSTENQHENADIRDENEKSDDKSETTEESND